MTIDLSDVQLDACLKRLHVANARRAWRELVQRAEREEWSYRDFLALLASEENRAPPADAHRADGAPRALPLLQNH